MARDVIGEAWRKYCLLYRIHQATDDDVEINRRSFYLGAAHLLESILESLELSSTQEEFQQRLQPIIDELRRHHDAMQEGKPDETGYAVGKVRRPKNKRA